MSTDVEELLADDLRRQADSVRWRPELLSGALRRHRRRRIRRRVTLPVLAVAGGAAVAVSVLAAVPGRSAPASRPELQTVAYVLSRTRSAVAAADSDVFEVRSQLATGWSLTSWFAPANATVRVDSHRARGGDTTFYAEPTKNVVVSYGTRTWWSQKLSAVLGRLSARQRQIVQIRHDLRLIPGLVAFETNAFRTGVPALTLPTPAFIRRELAAGRFRLVGSQTSGGQRLLELRATHWRDVLTGAGRHTLTVWVNAATYLPVRSVATGGPVSPLVSDFTWLPPTTANLAILTPRIPAGFTYRAPR